MSRFPPIEASLTDSSAWLIYNKMSQNQRNQLMTNLLSPNNGDACLLTSH